MFQENDHEWKDTVRHEDVCAEICGVEFHQTKGKDLGDFMSELEAEEEWRKSHVVRGSILNAFDFFRYRLPMHFQDGLFEVKCAWQRAFRGYDNAMLWSYWSQNAEQTLKVLKWMRNSKHGYPLITQEEFANVFPGAQVKHSGLDRLPGEEKWDMILDKMIAGFEALLASDDCFINVDGKYDHDATKAECERLNKIWEEGAALYIKFYRTLWD